MNIERTNSWIQLIGGIGVIAGLVFLAYELKQNAEMTAAQTRSELSQSVITLIEMERHPGHVAAYMKSKSGQALSREDKFYLDGMANATFRHWENTYYQYQKGLFDNEEFEADFEVWREAMLEPSYLEHWLTRRHTYSQSFREAIDQIVNEERHNAGDA